MIEANGMDFAHFFSKYAIGDDQTAEDWSFVTLDRSLTKPKALRKSYGRQIWIPA